jgi:hypothetical protein
MNDLKIYSAAQIARASDLIAPVACDDCGAPADTAHLLPHEYRPDSARFACPNHDPDGYCFASDRMACLQTTGCSIT